MKEQSESCRHRSGAGLRGSAALAGRRRYAVRLSPLTTVIAASVLTVMLLMGLGLQVRQSYLDHKGTQKQVFPIGQLRGKIIHFDEVLTMSANMAAATGDRQWEKRYRQFEPQLDVAIKSLEELVPETFDSAAAIQTDQANIKLVEMENQVFELVGQGRLDEAQAILADDYYCKQKERYSDGMERIAADLEDHITADLESHRKRALAATLSVLLGLPLLGLIWLWVLRNIRRHLKERDQAERALRESEERFRALFEQAAVGVTQIVTKTGEFLRINQKYCDIVGYSRKEMASRTFMEITHPDDLQEDLDNMKELVAGRIREFSMEKRYFHKNGQIVWVHLTVSPMWDVGQEPDSHMAVVEDITEQKLAEQALRESEERFRSLVGNIPGAVYRCQSTHPWRMEHLSEAVLEVTGYHASDFMEGDIRNFGDLILPEDADMVKLLVEESIAGHEAFEVEYRIRHADGGIRWVHETGRPVYDGGGEVLWLDGVILDVTESKQAEDLLRDSELNYRAIFNSVNDAIVVHGVERGEVLEANDRFCTLFGYTAEEVRALGVEGISEGNPPYSQAEALGFIKSAADGESPLFEWMCKDKQGRLFWVEVNLKLVVLQGAERILGVVRDISERKRSEEQVQNLAKFPSENPGPVLRVARDGTLLYANDASESILEEWGCREGEAVPDKWCGIIAEVFEARQEKKIEIEYAARVWSFMIVPVIEAGYVNLYCRDTTKRKRAEDALKLRFDLEELLTSISTEFIGLGPDEIDDAIVRAMESIIDAVCVDRGYIFLYSLNGDRMGNTHEYCRHGVPPHKDRLQDVTVEKFPWFDARIKRFETVAVDSVAALTEEAEAGKGEWLYEGILSLLCVPMVFQGRLMGFVGFDTVLHETQWRKEIITFVKILGTVFANAIERKRSGQERERLLRTLSAKNEELQSIVYVASHDLKSPLVNIQGFSGELSRTCEQIEELLHGEGVSSDIQKELAPMLDEDIPESIGFIRAGTVKMQALLNGLLEVSRVGSAALQIQSLDMNQMMKHIIASMQYQITDSDTDVIVDDLPGCIGDSDHVNQVFSNLLTNAVKYLDPDRKGEIHISGRAEAGESIFCVQDNGLGIAPQHQEKVFEIFHRLDPDRHAEGEGLGLTIALRILERHEGRIWVESEPGKGSKFFVLLPTA